MSMKEILNKSGVTWMNLVQSHEPFYPLKFDKIMTKEIRWCIIHYILAFKKPT